MMEKDCAYPTLMRCTMYEGDREALVPRIGNCDPHDLVRRMLEALASWWAFVDFAEEVIGVNEETGCTCVSGLEGASSC